MYCLCGYEISSKSVLYKHVSDHKLESKKLRKAAGIEEEKFPSSEYAALNVKDFVRYVKQFYV